MQLTARFTLLAALAGSAIAQSTSSSCPGPEVFKTMITRRKNTIMDYVLAAPFPPSDIPKWLSSLTPTGQWPTADINYRSGCGVGTAWAASGHWRRILTMAAAYHGGLRTATGAVDTVAEKYLGDPQLRAAIDLAMQWWFDNDFEEIGCLVGGGGPDCPCETPGLWSPNHFAGVYFIPTQVGQTCLLLNNPADASLPRLSDSHLEQCERMLLRAYGTMNHDYAWKTGGETVLLAKIGIDTGLLNANNTMLKDAYGRIHNSLLPPTDPRADGFHADGALGQRGGALYTGTYGSDYINVLVATEVLTPGTPYLAPQAVIDSASNLFEGSSWMIYENQDTGVVNWDPSTLGRSIVYPVSDNRLNARIQMNSTAVSDLGRAWNADPILKFSDSMAGNTGSVNIGDVSGAKVFHVKDYIVHRTDNYVSTLKMFSSRTLNSECANGQNPLGFHLSDGLRYTFVSGSEYTDMIHAWDWNLLPGITTDYGRTPLTCATSSYFSAESFVGGVSDGSSAIGVMRYTNPMTGGLKFQKAWFFLEGGREHVMVGDVWTNSTTPVYSVLDQKKREGRVVVDGVDVASQSSWDAGVSLFESASSLWHDNVGYVFSSANEAGLAVKVGERSGNWTAIGTSKQPPSTVNLFAGYLTHTASQNGSYRPISYTAFPAISLDAFAGRLETDSPTSILELSNTAQITAIYDSESATVYAVFWASDAGEVSFAGPGGSTFKLSASEPIAVIFDTMLGDLTVADPSRGLANVEVVVEGNSEMVNGRKVLAFEMPSERGTEVTRNLYSMA